MKRKRTLIILAVVLVVIIALIVVEKMVTRHVDALNTTDEVIISVAPDDVTALSIESDGETLTLAKGDDGWADPDDADYPVNQDAVAEFLGHFEEVHACFIIDDVEDYSQYGLDDPTATVTFTAGDTETVVTLGGFSTMDSERYVENGDGRVYLIEDDLNDYVTTNRDDFMKNDAPADIDQLTELKISGDTTMDIVYDPDGTYTYTDAYNYYDVSAGEHNMLEDTLVLSFLNNLSKYSPTDYATYTASQENLADYALETPAYTYEVTGTVTDEEGNEQTVSYILSIGAFIEEGEAEDGEEPEETITAYARFGESEIIYTMSDTLYRTLSAGCYDSLRPPEVLTLDWDKVTGITATVEDESYAFTPGDEEEKDSSADTSEDEDLTWKLNDQDVTFGDVKDAIDDLKISEFNEETADKVLEMSFVVDLDNETYPTQEVCIYRYDGDNCLVTLNGTTLGLMDRSLMVDLREAVNAIVLGTD